MTLIQPDDLQIELPLQAIAEQCRQLRVEELAVFGSVLREDFSAASDVDFLVRFIDNDAGEWMGKLQDLEAALGRLLGRKVDVVDWRGIERSTNPYRREHILRTARPIYAAG
jgi:predicted nucleotidyltransferase